MKTQTTNSTAATLETEALDRAEGINLMNRVAAGDRVLVKGSRGGGLDRTVVALVGEGRG